MHAFARGGMDGDATVPGKGGPGKVWGWSGEVGVRCGGIDDGAVAPVDFRTQRGHAHC